MQTLKARKIGTSLGFIVPKEMRDDLRISEGDLIFATKTPEGVQLTPYDPLFKRQMEAFEIGRKQYRNALRELAK